MRVQPGTAAKPCADLARLAVSDGRSACPFRRPASCLVDVFSYLVLGHVFVANQTGNFILLGMALAGAPGFLVSAQAVALVSFAVGAVIGGRINVRRADHRGRYLFAAAAGEGVFLVAGAVLAALTENPARSGYRFSLIFVLALAMGIQTASARKLAVPDLTTTTFTQLITATFSESAIGGGMVRRSVVE